MNRKFLKTKGQLDILAERKPKGRMGKSAHKKKRLVFLFFFFLILAGLIYFFVYSPVFRINRVIINGINEVENINAVQIGVNKYTEGYKFFIWPKNNILFLNKGKAVLFLGQDIKIEDIKIAKELPRTLIVEAKDKLPILFWQEVEQGYYIDKSGLVLAAVNDNTKYNLPVIARSTTTAVSVGVKIIGENDVSFIRMAIGKIGEKLRGFKIAKIEVKDYSNRDVSFYIDGGWRLIMSVAGEKEIDGALDNLVGFLEQEVVDTKQIEYIDIRIPDKIFYK